MRAVMRRVRPGQPLLARVAHLAGDRLLLDRAAHRAGQDGRELSWTPKAMALPG